MQTVTYEALRSVQQKALDTALHTLQYSYNPVSHFYVGACLYREEGVLIAGTNFENAALGSTICAERAAVLHANDLGYRNFVGIAIIARGEKFDTTEVTGPCGSCRQVLYEVSQISGCDLEVVLSTSKKDKIVVTTIGELLPLAFGPLDLGIDIKKYQTK